MYGSPNHIECVSLEKKFTDRRSGEEVVAITDFDFSMGSEEIVTVLGPSGCGKSTLLSLIAGFEQPTAGQLSLAGSPISGPGPDRGVVFQNHALFPWMTVEENVAYGLRERGLARAARMDTAREYLELVGLTGFGKRYPHELSGGMQQRVGIARVLAIEPKVMLMDEPFGALDAQTRAILQMEVMSIWRKLRMAIVFVTHSVDEAVLLGHRVLVMTARPGRIKEMVDVDLAWPRDPTSSDFNVYRRRAAQLIEDEVQGTLAHR